MFQDFSARQFESTSPDQPGSRAAAEVAELIARYPNLSEIELARLINQYWELTAVEVAMMISDEELGRKLDRFFSDHRAGVRTPFRQYAVLVAIAVLGILVTIWAIASAS